MGGHDEIFYPRFKLYNNATGEEFSYTEKVIFEIDQVWPIRQLLNPNHKYMKEEGTENQSIYHAWEYANTIEADITENRTIGPFRPWGFYNEDQRKNLMSEKGKMI